PHKKADYRRRAGRAYEKSEMHVKELCRERLRSRSDHIRARFLWLWHGYRDWLRRKSLRVRIGLRKLRLWVAHAFLIMADRFPSPSKRMLHRAARRYDSFSCATRRARPCSIGCRGGRSVT